MRKKSPKTIKYRGATYVRVADARDVYHEVLPVLEKGLEKYDALWDHAPDDPYASTERQFEKATKEWAETVADLAWKAEKGGHQSIYDYLDYWDIAKRTLADILWKLDPEDRDKDYYYHDLQDLENEAVEVATAAASSDPDPYEEEDEE